MIEDLQKSFESTLLRLRLIDQERLEKAKIESVRSGKRLEEVLENFGFIENEALTKATAIARGIPYVNLVGFNIKQDYLKIIPRDVAKKYKTVVFGKAGSSLNAAMENPNNVEAIDFIEKSTGCRLVPFLASLESIEGAIGQYEDLAGEVQEAIKAISFDGKPEPQKAQKQGLMVDLAQDAPVTRAVNTILEYAVKNRASDIHLEPRSKDIKIRYRIDGVLTEAMTLPLHLSAAIVSRIKILSSLKIDEHRIPQDGRFNIEIEKREIDIRVAVSPTVNGEKVVMRLLDKSGGVIDLSQLGLYGKAYTIIQNAIKAPHGMVLSTGPTGSGKTTSLYAVLTKLNTPGVNIITLEDPVEYRVEGVNQIQINTGVGLTFASGLRSILRQDPDIVMVGEIRDAEAADLAVQSALTGHMVLSTLHTNNAAGVLPRLLDMKIEPFLIASTVNTVIGQRLVRKLCSKCKSPITSNPGQTKIIKETLANIESIGIDLIKGYPLIPDMRSEKFTLWEAKGCEDCKKTGYEGRIGIFEVFDMNVEMEKQVLKRATTTEFQEVAVAQGMVTLRQDGFLKAMAGITSLEEVLAKAAEV